MSTLDSNQTDPVSLEIATPQYTICDVALLVDPINNNLIPYILRTTVNQEVLDILTKEAEAKQQQETDYYLAVEAIQSGQAIELPAGLIAPKYSIPRAILEFDSLTKKLVPKFVELEFTKEQHYEITNNTFYTYLNAVKQYEDAINPLPTPEENIVEVSTSYQE